jgi:iron complex outermembrane recepter protein
MQSHTKAKSTSRSRKAFPLNPLAASLAAILMASAPAYAQDTKTEEEKTEEAKKKQAADEPVVLESVKVQGFQRAVERSIAAKKDSDSIVEVISAEDIGKLPDNSIADAISRVSGITTQRVAGRASQINIRGFAGDFSTTLLNGREQVSVGENRGVEFDQYPSELIGGVTLYKTPDAKLIGQGLSGTVNLQTLKPLNFSDSALSLNARLEDNSLGEINPGYSDRGSRLSASYIDQFADNTVGIAFGIARLDSPGQRNYWEATGYTTGGGSALYLEGSKQQAASTDNTRTGIMGVLEYKPNSDFHSTLDVFYSTFEKAEVVRGMEMGLGWTGATPTNAATGTVFGLQHVVSGTFSGINPVQKHELLTSDDTLFSIGWNNKIRLNDNWTATVDVSGSSAKRDELILELYAGISDAADNPVPQSVGFVINPSTGLPTFSFGANNSDPNIVRLTDSSGWGQAGYTKDFFVRDDNVALRLDFRREFLEGPFRNIEFGINYSDRDKSRESVESIIRLANGGVAPVSIPSQFLQGPVNHSLTGGWNIISFDMLGVLNSGLYNFIPNQVGDINDKIWSVNEKVGTAFVQANLDTTWGSIPVRGNFGLQYVMSDQSSTGFATNQSGSVADPISGGAEYNDILPSLNLSFELPHSQFIRFGASKTLARERMDYLRASQQYSCDADPALATQLGYTVGVNYIIGTNCIFTSRGGNPEIEPNRANAYDLAYEKYFDSKAFIGLAYFYKDLKTYSLQVREQFDFTGFANTNTGGLIPAGAIGRTEYRVNGTGGYIKGWEFNATLPLGMFVDALDGFGFILNATDISSLVQRNQTTGEGIPFPGLSEFSANATIFYEKAGFSARVSRRYRGEFFAEDRGFAGNRDFNYFSPEGITDLQFGYKFSEEGRLDGLSLLLQVNNLTNESYGTYYTRGDDTAPRSYGEYGRQVLLGATYKF